LVETHGLRPIVSARFAFDEIRDAYDHLAAGKALGKVIIDFAQARSTR
jgi:D-arabinose 1-dehydrogenase-like Zn-dependent alcohol dehydrogenase